jgi:hypothetical protein
MQFSEPQHGTARCPVCGNPVVKRSTRGKTNFCSRVCASSRRYVKRYVGSMSGPADRPRAVDKTKL